MNDANDLAAVQSQPAFGFDVQRWRADFPILQQTVHGKPLVYLDNAATSQKPHSVIDCERRYYSELNANIHRSVHELGERATAAFEGARMKVRRFINAGDNREIVFVRGTTEAINLVAQSYGRNLFQVGDEILLTEMEHHSNIVPWQLLREQTGAVLRVAPINDAGELMLDEFEKCLNPRTKLVAVAHVSNALGSVNPIHRIIELAHAMGAVVLVDGAQAVPHMAVNVQDLDCDFYAFSGHKLYGPTGIGVLYGKAELLDAMPPYQGGGDMISQVTFKQTLYNVLPYKFEAGTSNIAGVIGLGTALDYVQALGLDSIAAHEHDLLAYATRLAHDVPGMRLIGTAQDKAGILSFTLDGVHPHDIGTILDREGVAIRAGHHCAMPVMEHFQIAATARASFALYNTRDEIDALFAGIDKVIDMFGRQQRGAA
ncbi:SufS family cysteine desulfurase [Paraherbaspirillum soli]|uniref:Cysteine desulfurase n=1 Tax=Paraherbaspirillum soli TaxID=631222 RepID=A0ABW0MCU0_9BURK